MKTKLAIALLISSSLFAWEPHADLVGRFGNYRKGAGLSLFSPLKQDGESILFAQGLGGWFRDQWTLSLGGGYRSVLAPNLAMGVNAFFDTADSRVQGGVGVELFGNCWDLRANGYLPSRRLGKRQDFRGVLDQTTVFAESLTHRTQGYAGIDIEGGYGYCALGGQFWGHLGYYHFSGSYVKPIQGPRLRGDYRLASARYPGAELTLGGEYEWNWLHGNTFSGAVSIRVPLSRNGSPLSPSCCDSLCRQMGDRVYRNHTIWVDTDTKISRFADPAGFLFFVSENGFGVGTQTNPMSIEDANAIATPGATFFLLQDDGDILSLPRNDGWILGAAQRVYGFGDTSSVTIPFNFGGAITVQDLTGAGRATILTNPVGGNHAITLNSGVLIQGIRADANNEERGISNSFEFYDMTVRDVIFENFDFEGLRVSEGGGNFLVERCQFINTVGFSGSEGIFALLPGGTSLTVRGCHFEARGTDQSHGVTLGELVTTNFVPTEPRIDVVIEDCTSSYDGMTQRSLINFSDTTVADWSLLVRNNDFTWNTGSSDGVVEMRLTFARDGVLDFDIQNNTLINEGLGNGVRAFFFGPLPPGVFAINGLIRNNPIISAPEMIFIESDFQRVVDSIAIAVQDNPNLTGGDTALRMFADSGAGGTLSNTSIQCLRNTHNPAVYNDAVGSFIFETSATYQGNLCAQVTDNTIVTGGVSPVRGIQLDNQAANSAQFRINGPDGATLSGANNSIGVEDIGATLPGYQLANFTCPTPVFP